MHAPLKVECWLEASGPSSTTQQKTGKRYVRAIPSWAIPLLKELWDRSPVQSPTRTIFDKVGRKYIYDLHNELQERAGVPAERRAGFHTWRRLHGQVMGSLGLAFATNVSAAALSHSDVSTTSGHYVDLATQLTLRFPSLLETNAPAVATD